MHPRIFHPGALTEGAELRLKGTEATHLGKVLRVRGGDEIILFNGDGLDHMARIISTGRHDMTIEIGECRESDTESPIDVTLLQGICKNQHMDMLIQKSTELGVRTIRPVICERGVVRINDERIDRKVRHWRRVAISACEQCGQTLIPEFGQPEILADAIERLDATAARIILDPAGSEILQAAIGTAHCIVLLVGPEGGLTKTETSAALKAGFRTVRLGPRVLRTETAPVAALSIIQYLIGDLGER